jgi:hypothetical protein
LDERNGIGFVKTANYSNQEKENIHYDYFKNLIKNWNWKVIIETDLQTKIEDVINEYQTRQMKKNRLQI